MKKIIGFFILGILVSLSLTDVRGQEVIPNFSLTNAVNKKPIALNDLNNANLVVIIFTSNYCPYSKLYEERIKNLASQYSGDNVKFLLINPNDPEKSSKDAINNMASRAKTKNFPFPYLADKNQKVAKVFNASKTPEAFLLKNNGNKYRVVYEGAIDDNPQVPEDVREHYLKEAIEASINGRPVPVKKTKPTGCMIKE